MSALGWLTARPIAHRGLHDAAAGVIENTASAFRAAIAAGYAIECDVQVTADGEAMVHHDDRLGRLAEGAGRLDAMTAAELKRVPFRAGGDRMMTLGELCDLTAGLVPLVIELKSRFDGERQLAARAATVLSGYHGPAALISFDPDLIAGCRNYAPRLPRGLVVEHRGAGKSSGQAYLRRALQARPQFLAYSVRDVTGSLPRLARNLFGVPLLTWTVRTPDERRVAAAYADQMIFEGFRP